MATRVEKFNRDNIEWAIQRAGVELDDIVLSFPKLNEWISGEHSPTVKQLEKFTKKLHVPFGYMFSDRLPDEKLAFPFFRIGKKATDKVSLNVYLSLIHI